MSLINDLHRRAEAHPRPTELTIKLTDVGTLADSMRATMWFTNDGTPIEVRLEEFRRQILDGKVRFLGIPVRVLGADHADHVNCRCTAVPLGSLFVNGVKIGTVTEMTIIPTRKDGKEHNWLSFPIKKRDT
jgi:hypothetical protein